jgi:outer membrane protein TolC
MKNSRDRLKDAESKFQARVVTKFDVLRAQTDTAASEQNLIVAKNTVQSDLASLNFAIGIPVITHLEIDDKGAIVLPPAQGPEVNSTQDDLGDGFNASLKEALASRPEIGEATAAIEAAKRGVTLARKTELPTLNLSWSYLYAPNAGGSNPLVHTWVAQAIWSLPIFDGGVARARKQEAEGGLSQAQTAKESAIEQVTLETQQAYLAVLESKQRINVADQSLRQAEEAFNLAKVRYKAGVSARSGISPLLELSDAQAALTFARTNSVNALYDYDSSLARLDRAMGRNSR